MKLSRMHGMQVLWMVISIFALTTGIGGTIKRGFAESYPLFIVAIVAFLFSLLRRYMKKQQDLKDKQQN